jgi:cobalt/nickel transport system permease protein
MGRVKTKAWDIGYLDRLARQDSAVHRLDPRAKLITTLVFVVSLVSFPKHEIAAMAPYLIFPVFLAGVGRIPGSYVVRKMLWVAPFAVLMGIFNPLLDTQPLVTLGPVTLSGGWVSFFSILARFTLTVSTVLVLIAVTGFDRICQALERLGTPRVFVVQLMFLYRYLFVLVDEAARMVRARSLRNFSGKTGIAQYGGLLGHLLLRTLDRAQRIHQAMLCRGFDGEVRTVGLTRPGASDPLFALSWSLFFVLGRLVNLPQHIGQFITGVFV